MSYKLLMNRIVIYDTLFFGVRAVAEYPNLKTFESENYNKYVLWRKFVEDRFGSENLTDEYYHKYSPYYPEFSKIVSIVYATIENKDNKINRNLKVLNGDTESEIITVFADVLDYYENFSNNSTPKFDYVLGGYDIVNYDIPYFIKKFIKLYNKDNNRVIPTMLKNYLQSQPWNSNVVNFRDLYNFNSKTMFTNIDIMVDYLGLKQAENIIADDLVSKYYWENIEIDKVNTTKKINLTISNKINTSIQFMNNFRYL